MRNEAGWANIMTLDELVWAEFGGKTYRGVFSNIKSAHALRSRAVIVCNGEFSDRDDPDEAMGRFQIRFEHKHDSDCLKISFALLSVPGNGSMRIGIQMPLVGTPAQCANWVFAPIESSILAYKNPWYATLMGDYHNPVRLFPGIKKGRSENGMIELASGEFSPASNKRISLVCFLKYGMAKDINEAKASLFETMADVWNLRSFKPQKRNSTVLSMAEKIIRILETKKEEMRDGVTYYKMDVGPTNLKKSSPEWARYFSSGFVGFQAITAKALLYWYRITGDTDKRTAATKAARGCLDFQIKDRKNPNHGAFWDVYDPLDKSWKDLNGDRYLWFWPSIRTAYHLLGISTALDDSNMREAAMACLTWALGKRNAHGYWDRDKVDETGRVCGFNNTIHGVETVRLLVLAYKVTGNVSYLRHAEDIANIVTDDYLATYHTGDLFEDLQQENAEQGWGMAMLINNLLPLYRVTKKKKYLSACQKAAQYLLVWQCPQTPGWHPAQAGLAGMTPGETLIGDLEGGFRFLSFHETIESAEAMFELFSVDGDERWLHSAVASLNAVSVSQKRIEKQWKGAIPEQFPPGTFGFAGWNNSEAVVMSIRAIISIAKTAVSDSIDFDWETMTALYRGRKYHLVSQRPFCCSKSTEDILVFKDENRANVIIVMMGKPGIKTMRLYTGNSSKGTKNIGNFTEELGSVVKVRRPYLDIAMGRFYEDLYVAVIGMSIR
jgi:hypothetical protein